MLYQAKTLEWVASALISQCSVRMEVIMLYKIAGLTIAMDCLEKTIREHVRDYEAIENGGTDIDLHINSDQLNELHKNYSYLTENELEYIYTGYKFATTLLDFNGFCLHASAISLDQNAILFSAPSGTGKSTHTGLWHNYFGKNRLIIINDDKPAIRYIENSFYVYGTPWSGKCNLQADIKVPLKAIVFIRQSNENNIRRLDNKEAICFIMKNSIKPLNDPDKMNCLLDLHDALIRKIPMYELSCDISFEAVKLVYHTIFSDNDKK